MAQNSADTVRVVLEVTTVKVYSVFELANPDRLVVDVYGPDADMAPGATAAKRSPSGASRPSGKPAVTNRGIGNRHRQLGGRPRSAGSAAQNHKESPVPR